MPSIAKIGRQTTIRGLAKSLFGNEAATPEALNRAEATLLAANPSLGGDQGFHSGRVVIVPDLQGGRAAQIDNAGALESLDDALTQIGKAAAAALASEPREAATEAEKLRTQETTAAVRERYPDLLDDLPVIARTIEQRGSTADARYRAVEAAAAQARKDLARLAAK
jgi:hypothetical protein